MQNFLSRTRGIALLTGGVFAASAFIPALGLSVARADEKSDRKARQYKTGAIALGAAAAYFGLKSKKAVPAIVAGAGAYYAYKKSKEAKREGERDRYGNYPNDDQYAQYPDDNDGYGVDNRDYGNRDYGRNDRDRYGRNDDAGYGSYDPADYGNGGNRNENCDDSNNGNYGNPGGSYGGEDVYARYPDYGSSSLKARNARAKTKVAKRAYAVK